jgi:hypothetical protein
MVMTKKSEGENLDKKFYAASQLELNYLNQSAIILNSTVENEGNDCSIRTDNRDIFRL